MAKVNTKRINKKAILKFLKESLMSYKQQSYVELKLSITITVLYLKFSKATCDSLPCLGMYYWLTVVIWACDVCFDCVLVHVRHYNFNVMKIATHFDVKQLNKLN